MSAEVVLTPKGHRWQKTGHPWVYQDDIARADRSLSGQIVQVQAPDGKPLGQAFYHATSKLALRWLTDSAEEAVDRAFWAKRLEAALGYRKRIVSDSTAWRLISSEADQFPGLIVDRYGQVLVLQSLSLGMERILPLLVELLLERVHPKAILARNDSQVRQLEGLPLEKRWLTPTEIREIEVTEGKIRYRVDLWEGQKTGAYLDQRENRLRSADFAHGRVLDAFAYQGGFALQAASKASEVLAIEDSQWALSRLEENLKLNQIANVRAQKANAFDRLRALEKAGERFDLVILDPPAFAKSRKEALDALRGYREINLRAIKLLPPGGILISCSCSYLVDDGTFLGVVRDAAADARRRLRLLEIRTQSKDHPILLTHPESKYLKCLILEAL